jgi:hypothetical protein
MARARIDAMSAPTAKTIMAIKICGPTVATPFPSWESADCTGERYGFIAAM